jgi:hypothetical protein
MDDDLGLGEPAVPEPPPRRWSRAALLFGAVSWGLFGALLAVVMFWFVANFPRSVIFFDTPLQPDPVTNALAYAAVYGSILFAVLGLISGFVALARREGAASLGGLALSSPVAVVAAMVTLPNLGIDLSLVSLIVLYALSLLASVAAALAVVRMRTFRTWLSAAVVAAVSFAGGFYLATFVVITSWSPLAMFAAFLPFLAVSVWMSLVAVSRLRSPHPESHLV